MLASGIKSNTHKLSVMLMGRASPQHVSDFCKHAPAV